jgi:divalent metal cation (Fe/Co/Zn/Cd) transporter
MAELVHSLVDLFSAAAVLAGLKLSSRKTEAITYGLYKLENLVAAVLAALVFLSAYNVAREALAAAPRLVRVDGWMLVVLAAALAIPLLSSHFELRAGQASNSPALIASAKEYRMHLLTTGCMKNPRRDAALTL